MKKIYSVLIVLLTILLSVPSVSAQSIEPIPIKKFYKDRVTRNLQFLCKEAECLDNVVINERGVYIYPNNSRIQEPQFTLYWREMPHFVNLLEEKTDEELIELLERKGKKYFYGMNTQEVDPARYPVSELVGLKVALDPGHMAATWEQALLERRYVKVEGEYYNQNKDITFFEANLAYTTALVLQDSLEKLGATVMLTHEYGKSAFGMDYEEWKDSDRYDQDIINGYKRNWYNREKFEFLKSGDAPDYVVFHDVFRNLDFVTRAELINEFEPNITLVLHLNASEGSRRYDENYLPPVDENYSMVFIPGAFLGFEVDGRDESDQRFELLRLLVSYDLEESDIFASNIIKALDSELGVKALPVENKFQFTTDYSIKSDLSDGVYHRNLYLTRVVEGPIAYAEALYQDNRDEIPLLGSNDLVIDGITTSSRVKEMAHVYLSAIKEWLAYNIEFTKKLDALYEDKYGDEEQYEEEMRAQSEPREEGKNK